jgi:hypothetical protein
MRGLKVLLGTTALLPYLNPKRIMLTCPSFREILALSFRQGADLYVLNTSMTLTSIHSPACRALSCRWSLQRQYFPHRRRRDCTLTINLPINGFIILMKTSVAC